jgi:hypothetical protein
MLILIPVELLPSVSAPSQAPTARTTTPGATLLPKAPNLARYTFHGKSNSRHSTRCDSSSLPYNRYQLSSPLATLMYGSGVFSDLFLLTRHFATRSIAETYASHICTSSSRHSCLTETSRYAHIPFPSTSQALGAEGYNQQLMKPDHASV